MTIIHSIWSLLYQAIQVWPLSSRAISVCPHLGLTGRTAIDRLIHVISHAPNLATPARSRALELLIEPSQRDTSLLQLIAAASTQSSDNTVSASQVDIDSVLPNASAYRAWAEETTERNAEERTKLEVELKTYTNNMIKESIRLAHRDFAIFYRATGNFEGALRHYTKSREFSTTPAHMLEMCLSVLEVRGKPLSPVIARHVMSDILSSLLNNATMHTSRHMSSRPNLL
jgi:hypothetical protein